MSSDKRIREGIKSLQLSLPGASPPVPPMALAPIPSFAPFPVDALPVELRDLATAGAAAIGCDPTFVVLPGLTTLSAAIGTTHRVEIKSGWREPPFISTAVIAQSGAKKTPPYKLACEDPAEDINDDLQDQHGHERAEHAAALKRWEARRKDDDAGRRPPEPVERRFAVSDITLERLIGRLQDNPRGLLVYRDELDGWLRSFTRYASGGASDLPTWLSLFNAATLNYSRKSGDKNEVRVRGVGVAVTGTIQPAVMRTSMSPALMSAGLFARLAVAMPPVPPRVWTDDDVCPRVIDHYGQLVRRLFRLDFAERCDRGRTKPRVLTLSPQAKKLFVAFYNRNGEAMYLADAAEAASRSKLEAYAARLALVFSRCHPILPDEVTAEDMTAGVRIAEWFCEESVRVYKLLRESEEAFNLHELAERVTRLAAANSGRVTARELHKANKSRFPNPQHAELALDQLVGAGFGAWAESLTGTRGRPARVFLPRNSTPNTPKIEGERGNEAA